MRVEPTGCEMAGGNIFGLSGAALHQNWTGHCEGVLNS